jgi:hypothetical protein
LALTCRLGCNDVQVESDSTDVTDEFNGTQTRWSESAAIFADCVNLASNIDSITFDHISREANKVAHELARIYFRDKNHCNWDDEPPNSG